MRRADRSACRIRRRPRWRLLAALSGMAAVALGTAPALAYSAAGDRTFPATLVLPQIAPADETYFTASTLPTTHRGVGSADRTTNLSVVYAKTLTDRVGIYLEETHTRIDRIGARPSWGWQNTDIDLKYMVVNNRRHEFLLTLGLDREFGGTGARRVGASPSGVTAPQIFFGKGLGDLAVPLLRPVALVGFASPQIADRRPRPDLFSSGFAVEYSIPYLESKVRAVPLPDFVRATTPTTEMLVTAPMGSGYGARTQVLAAPGFVYSGQGWEAGVEALIPANRAAGGGVGVIAQVHVALDFLFPETLGRPLFRR